jgi:cell division cycle protein 20 (cofactor of APC complex)
LSVLDIRVPGVISKFKAHNYPLTAVTWSPDGTLLATGDANGITHIWDQRVGKSLLNSEATTKMRHRGKVKAIAWCPWQHDLLATGTTAPEGKIRIWNTSSISSSTPTPTQTIPLNTSVTSLHWSPHCKELLSTHGSSFTPVLQSGLQNQGTSSRLKYTKSPLMNSIVVHQYPSCKRLMTLTNAHTSSLTHSCLGPTGENIFTICPNEETIKMWKVLDGIESFGQEGKRF